MKGGGRRTTTGTPGSPAECPFYEGFTEKRRAETEGVTCPNSAAQGLPRVPVSGERPGGARGPGSSAPAPGPLGSGSPGVGGGGGRSAGGAGRSWGRSAGRERPVRRAGSGSPRGARGVVPGVELLAVGEGPHVVVAHEVAAAHGARALVGHEAPLHLKLRVGAQAQAGHRRRLPAHPEEQQQQRRRRGPPAPGPQRHRGRGGGSAGRGRGAARARGARAAHRAGLGAAAFANVERNPGPARAAATTPSPGPPPPATSERGEEPRPRARRALPWPPRGAPRAAGWRLQRGPARGRSPALLGTALGP